MNADGDAVASRNPTVLDVEAANALVSPGLWMGTGVSDMTIPIEPALDRGGNALHLAGDGNPGGADIFWHTAFPVEREFSTATFWARTARADGQELRVTVGGPGEFYWRDVAAGDPWSVATFRLDGQWRRFRIAFADLEMGPGQFSPYSEPYGALHFLLPPDQAYDLWLDDIELLARTGR